MAKTIVQLPDFRRAMADLGYKVAVRTNADFRSAKVTRDGVAINAGTVLTSEHLAEHRGFYKWKEGHSVRDGDMIVTF